MKQMQKIFVVLKLTTSILLNKLRIQKTSAISFYNNFYKGLFFNFNIKK